MDRIVYYLRVKQFIKTTAPALILSRGNFNKGKKLFLSFSLMKKKQKIKPLDFRPSTSGSLPKTQKLARSFPRGLRQFVFINGPTFRDHPVDPGLPNPMAETEFLSNKIVLSIFG
ncbi:MAG: hypothetical protein FGM16_08885 [Flavobacterium sp.]|nr:hypothetical protein [Flavobacterium sp.]